MADTFRVALSGDFRKADGSPTFPDFDLAPLRGHPGIEVAYLEPGPSSFSLILVVIGVVMGSSGLWVRSLARRGIGHMEGENVAS